MLIDSLLFEILEAMIIMAKSGTDLCGIRDLTSLEEILSTEIKLTQDVKKKDINY